MKISTAMPRAASRRDDLDDVDVHAAGVAGAGLVERAGVHRERRHPPGRAGAGERRAGTRGPPALLGCGGARTGTPVDSPSCNSVRMTHMSGTDHSHSPDPRPLPRRRPHRRRHRGLQRHRRGHRAPAGRRGLRRRASAPGGSTGWTALAGVDRRRARCRWTSPTPASVAAFAAALDRVDVLVNNAGGAFDAGAGGRGRPRLGQRIYDVNVLGHGAGDQGAAAGAAGGRRRATSCSSARPPGWSPTRAARRTPRPSTACTRWPRRCGWSSTASRCG